MESCNLQSIMKAMAATKSFSKALSDSIRDTRESMIHIENEIKRMAPYLQSKSCLTRLGFIYELTDEQLRSLLLDVNWREASVVYRVDEKKIVNISCIKNAVDDVCKRYGSLKDCLGYLESKSFSLGDDANAKLCFDIFRKALEAWFPNRQELRRMKELQTAFIGRKSREDEAEPEKYDDSSEDENKDGDEDNEDEDNEDEGSEDEDYVNQLLEARMVSIEKEKEEKKSKDGLVLFKFIPSWNKNILIEASDYPDGLAVSPLIRSITNLWDLNEIEKFQFLFCILEEKATRIVETLEDHLSELRYLKRCKEELEMSKKIEILSRKKIIGMTITGASINHDLLHFVDPNVVIVEEAAEILEPSLLAALTPSTEHLILIGDHKQLRPQVDTYELCRSFRFDVSMMERLIESEFPFKSLRKQNRMRPEFSSLLRDIYPNLEDNLPVVSENTPLKCIEKSMYFWNHEDPEKKDRTYTNIKEAERIVALVIYLLSNGCSPSEITVLAAYLGQTKLLRKMLKREKKRRPGLFEDPFGDNVDDNLKQNESSIQVQTIDMYQGDENKYVLISLVRSNNHGGIGFLKEMNRRCVAQSRARCGMYFVGNLTTLAEAKGSCWYKFISTIIDLGCAGYAIPLQCPKHEGLSRFGAVDTDSIDEVIANPKRLCNQLCAELYSCKLAEHSCKKPCFPHHEHDRCPEIVVDKSPTCGHTIKRKCPEKIADYICKTEVEVVLSCGHGARKECHQRSCDILCDVPVTDIFPRCGHKTERKCYVKLEEMSCAHQCKEMNSCGVHQCKKKCGKSHGHDSCPQRVNYKFPRMQSSFVREEKVFRRDHMGLRQTSIFSRWMWSRH